MKPYWKVTGKLTKQNIYHWHIWYPAWNSTLGRWCQAESYYIYGSWNLVKALLHAFKRRILKEDI